MYYNIMLEAAEGRDESNPFIQAPTPSYYILIIILNMITTMQK